MSARERALDLVVVGPEAPLVAGLSAEQLRSFPLERLPREIPIDAAQDIGDERKQAVLDDLAWAACTAEADSGANRTERLAPEIGQALDAAEQADPRGADELDRLTEEMGRRWRAEDYGRDLLDESTQRLEQARDLARRLGEEIGRLNRSLAVIDRPFAGKDDFQDTVSEARARAKRALARMESALGRYELIELDIAHGAMRATQMRCDGEMRRLRELDEQIESLRARLRSNKGLGRLLKPNVARQQRELLLQRLQSLTERRQSTETFVSEDDLLRWLNALVEASLHVPIGRWRQKAQKTRLLLYRLLNLYCLQQEMAAQQLAASKEVSPNAKQAIGYYLSSERFILEYFSRKRQEVTLWLSGAASEKLSQLDRVRDAILADYRRNARRGTEGG